MAVRHGNGDQPTVKYVGGGIPWSVLLGLAIGLLLWSTGFSPKESVFFGVLAALTPMLLLLILAGFILALPVLVLAGAGVIALGTRVWDKLSDRAASWRNRNVIDHSDVP